MKTIAQATKGRPSPVTIVFGMRASCLAFAGCGGVMDGDSGLYDLQGTWERTEAAWEYVPGSGWQSLKGKLVISYNSVTISGPMKHPQDFTRNIALEACTEDGPLYIKNTGEWKSPVAYRLWQSADHKDTLITLAGGGVEDETLKRIGG